MRCADLILFVYVVMSIAGGVSASPPRVVDPIRVVCVGDSITYGARVADRGRNAYPAQLQYRLGSGYEVRNLGVGGRTLLADGDTPYIATEAWAEALAAAPDIAIVMLGTNDTCLDARRANWTHQRWLERDARAMVEALAASNPEMRIFLASPPPIFPGVRGLEPARVSDLAARAPRRARIGAALASVAAERPEARFVDLDGVFPVSAVVDGVHTTPFGAEALATRFAEIIRGAVNPATTPVPSAEYRGQPAGWGGGTWWGQFDAMRTLAAEHPDASVVFLGDSITQGLTGSQDRVARPNGPRPFDRAFGSDGAIGLGVSGDRTEHLLYRIEHGALAVLDPEVIVVQIGVNNVNARGHTAEETAAGIVAVVELLRVREPQAEIVVCGPFPLGARGEPRRATIDEVHDRLGALDGQPQVTRIDMRPLFLDAEGRTNERMAADRVHLTAAGVEAWIAAMQSPVAERRACARARAGGDAQ